MARGKHVGKIVVSLGDERVPLDRRLAGGLFREDRSYLVTGGLGGFGLAVAGWLVEQGAREIVLAGRRGAAGDPALQAIAALRARGATVVVKSVDVGDAPALAAVIAELEQEVSPLGGVFHAAMVLDDGLLSQLDPARIEAVMRPKAAGALNLDLLTRAMPIDHFVLFSSVSALVGNPGQASYAAANAYLDGLARRRRFLGLPALSVQWGALSDVGVVASDTALRDRLEQLGVRPFTSAEALSTLGRLLHQDAAVLSFADVDWSRWSERSHSPRFEHVSAPSDEGIGGVRHALREQLLALPSDRRLDVVEEQLRERVSEITQLPREKVDGDRTLDGMGIDSLMAVELSLKVETSTGIVLPTGLLMRSPTLRGVAAYILAELLIDDKLDEAAVDSMSDDEADALLEALVGAGAVDLETL
jgi:acyl carrier protein